MKIGDLTLPPTMDAGGWKAVHQSAEMERGHDAPPISASLISFILLGSTTAARIRGSYGHWNPTSPDLSTGKRR
jgi:hypothetical protein